MSAASHAQNRLLTKIYSGVCFCAVVRRTGYFAAARLGRKDVRSTGLGIFDSDLVASSGGADFRTARDVEEGASEEDFERGLLYYLDLEVHRDGAKLNWVILDES